MRVLSVQFTNVGVHDGRTLQLPDKGALVITGPNGSGKSSFVEGVALGLWGESLRGEPLWRDGVQGVVTVEVAVGQTKLIAVRKRTKAGAKSLSWWWSGEEPVKYETPTKAQEALEAVIGTFDSWRRTCVLSSADSAHFSLATDAERKRLLERLLGIDRLDAAADAARADARKAEQLVVLAETDARNASSHTVAAHERVKQALDALAALTATTVVPADAKARLAALRQKLAVADEESRDANAESAGLREALANVKAELAAATRRAALAAKADCPTCEQPIPDDLKQRLIREEAAARAAVEANEAAFVQRQKAITDTLRELDAEMQAIREEGTRLKTQSEMAERNAALGQTLSDQHKKAEDALVEKQAHLDAMTTKLATQRAEALLAKTVSEVFGLKGVRAHLLDAALRQIERVANRHLTTLGAGLKIALTSTTEKKAGGTTDAIALRVSVRASFPRSYSSLSGGERRRVDVAVLLALAEVAASNTGRADGVLWMDEVFDALDGDGVEAVGSLVEGLSNRRPIVVITHSDSLVRSLGKAQRCAL